MRKAFRSKSISRKAIPYLFILPTLAIMCAVIAYPLIRALTMSFFRYYLFDPIRPFVGLEHYRYMLFEDPNFLFIVRNTLIWTGVSISVCFIFALGVALLLNQKVPGVGIFRALALTPWAVPPVVACMMFYTFYDPSVGVFNQILVKKLHLLKTNIAWLTDPSMVLWSLIILISWKYNAFFIIGILAGLQSIPSELHEVARIDGANAFQRFWHITLPLLRPILTVLIVLNVIWRLNHFDAIWALTRGGPAYHSHLIGTYSYSRAFLVLDFGYGTAVGIFGLLILFGFVLIFTRKLREVAI